MDFYKKTINGKKWKTKKEGYYLVIYYIKFARHRSNKNSNVANISHVVSSESDSDSDKESSQYCT